MEKERHPNFINKVGEKYITNEGYEIEVVEYYNYKNCTVVFNDKNRTVLKNKNIGDILKGSVKNPNHPSVCKIGYVGVGKFKGSRFKKSDKKYTLWCNMLHRCYGEKENNLSYKDVTVCEEWHDFQNFAKWFEESWRPWMDKNWHLDKDILVKGNKIYSPQMCVFVPREVNSLFTKNNIKRGKHPIGVNYDKTSKKFVAQINNTRSNQTHLGYFDTPEQAFQAYKIAKEYYIKKVANEWKEFIDQKVYEAMYNYQVEITD